MRKRYLARSAAGSDDQPFANASRAAPTAASTSASLPCPTSASRSSEEGEIVSYVSVASIHAPPTKWPYRSWRRTMSRDSGAGA